MRRQATKVAPIDSARHALRKESNAKAFDSNVGDIPRRIGCRCEARDEPFIVVWTTRAVVRFGCSRDLVWAENGHKSIVCREEAKPHPNSSYSSRELQNELIFVPIGDISMFGHRKNDSSNLDRNRMNPDRALM